MFNLDKFKGSRFVGFKTIVNNDGSVNKKYVNFVDATFFDDQKRSSAVRVRKEYVPQFKEALKENGY